MRNPVSILWLLAVIPAALLQLAFVAIACLAYPLLPKDSRRGKCGATGRSVSETTGTIN